MTGHIEACERKISALVCSWVKGYEMPLRDAIAELVGQVQKDEAWWHGQLMPTLRKHAWPILTDALVRLSKLPDGQAKLTRTIARVALIESGLIGVDVTVAEEAGETCGACKGTGREAGHHGLSDRKCATCGGSGEPRTTEPE